LRRIFEKLIEEARIAAAQKPGWDQTEFEKQLRMEEKILFLKDELPAFLVENRRIYGILSTGIHELSEQECLDYFEVVKNGMELILDEHLHKHNQAAKRKSTADAIANVSGKIKK